ncbi:MAG: hypothetical protein ABH878_01235 [bacterium]
MKKTGSFQPLTITLCSIGILLLLGVMSVFAQTADSSAAALEKAPPKTDWRDGGLIELDAVQIEGEIAQPNVAITVARQLPQFESIALQPTLLQGLSSIGATNDIFAVPEAQAINDWRSIIEQPRE